MPLQPSRGLFEIKFVSALAVCSSVVAVVVAPLAAESLTEHLASMRATASVAGESQGRQPHPNVKENLQSELKFNQETSKNADRLPRNLYYPPEIDTYSKEQNTDFRELDRATKSESFLRSGILSASKKLENSAISQTKATFAQLPNRGDDRREIPLPNRVLPTPAPPEQLLQPAAAAPTQPQELLNITGTIKVDRFEVVGSTVFNKADSASVTYTNSEGSNGVDFSYTLPVNSRNGTVSLGLNRSKSNIVEPPFEALDIEASGSTYELTYRQPTVQTARTEIAIGIGAGRRESHTSMLGKDFPVSPGSDVGG